MNEPSDTRADVLLRQALALLAPLARLLVANGVSYPAFSQQLKRVFLDAARQELRAKGERATDSAMSLLSGVHRKDVRVLTRTDVPVEEAKRPFSFAAEVVAHWMTDARFTDAEGSPRRLPIRSTGPDAVSFEELTQAVSRDFHPRAVLTELVRLGAVSIEGDEVTLVGGVFVPSRGFAEMAHYLGANVSDHIAAAVANIVEADRGGRPPFIEYAVGADELSAQSAEAVQQLAKRLILSAFMRVSNEAERRIGEDRPALAGGRGARLRFGAYFYIEPPNNASPDETAGNALRGNSDGV